jgi:hypothetical protein
MRRRRSVFIVNVLLLISVTITKTLQLMSTYLLPSTCVRHASFLQKYAPGSFDFAQSGRAETILSTNAIVDDGHVVVLRGKRD